MSDGDNATPGRSGPRKSDGDSEWLTRTPRPSFGAAPWERRVFPANRPIRDSATSAEDGTAPTGNHTEGGLTVADLIAKLGAKPDNPTSHRIAPESEHVDEPAADAAPDDAITAVIPRAQVDLPDLEATAQLPRADKLPPNRVGRKGTTASKKPKRKRHPVMAAGRVTAAMAAVLSLILTGGAWQWNNSKNNSLKNVSALDPDSRDIVDPNAQWGDENFLIVGVDSRAGANSEVGAGDSEDAGGARSDTVMLVNIPASRERVVAVSFPRDLAITPMLCEAWDADTGEYGPLYDEETGTYGPEEWYTETKLNSAYSYGGPKCLVKVIQKLSGLSINRFMAVDFVGFEKMVDALGGVEVCSTTPLEDYELGTVLEKPGRQIVDGHTALNYVRARQVTTEINGDYGRIKRQQLFLSSLLRSMISKEVFFHLSKLNNVVNMFINDSYVDNIKTKDLVDLGQSIQGVAAGRMSFVTVPTTGETDADGNEPPRSEDIRALFDAIINDDPLPGENNENETTTPVTSSATPDTETGTTDPPSTASAPETPDSPDSPESSETVDAITTDPQEVTVHVSNSTGQDGLGATAVSELQQYGFNVLTPDDYPSSLEETTVFFAPGNEQAAATVAAAFPDSQLQRVSGMGDVVQVVLGSDFSTVSAPPPSGSAVSVQLAHNTAVAPTHLPEDLSITNAADTTCE